MRPRSRLADWRKQAVHSNVQENVNRGTLLLRLRLPDRQTPEIVALVQCRPGVLQQPHGQFSLFSRSNLLVLRSTLVYSLHQYIVPDDLRALHCLIMMLAERVPLSSVCQCVQLQNEWCRLARNIGCRLYRLYDLKSETGEP